MSSWKVHTSIAWTSAGFVPTPSDSGRALHKISVLSGAELLGRSSAILTMAVWHAPARAQKRRRFRQNHRRVSAPTR